MIGNVAGDGDGGGGGGGGGGGAECGAADELVEDGESHKFETFDIAGFVEMSNPLCRYLPSSVGWRGVA